MFSIQMLTISKGDKKLRSIGIFASVGHCHQPSPGKFQPLMNLVFERLTVYRLPSIAGSSGITSLNHKPRNHPMEDGIVIIFIHTQLQKIPGGNRSLSPPYFNFQLPMRCKNNNFSIGIGLLFEDSGLHRL